MFSELNVSNPFVPQHNKRHSITHESWMCIMISRYKSANPTVLTKPVCLNSCKSIRLLQLTVLLKCDNLCFIYLRWLGVLGGRCYSFFFYFKPSTSKRVMEREEIWGGNGVKKKIMWKPTAGAPKCVINFHITILKCCRNCSRWIYKLHSSCLLMPAHINATHEHRNNGKAVATQL